MPNRVVGRRELILTLLRQRIADRVGHTQESPMSAKHVLCIFPIGHLFGWVGRVILYDDSVEFQRKDPNRRNASSQIGMEHDSVNISDPRLLGAFEEWLEKTAAQAGYR